MNKSVAFEGKILEDGHLSVPQRLKHKLNLKRGDIVNAVIRSVKDRKNSWKELLKLAGTWKDTRSVEEIIKDIYESRKSSMRLTEGL